jgi:cyclophilin family peptidyl-prolyl cis-trans isomerase
MMSLRQAFYFVALVAGLGLGCRPDNQQVTAPGSPPGLDHEQSAAHEDFDNVFARWKRMLGELRGLELAYYIADNNDRIGLASQFEEERARGKQLESELIQAAIRCLVSRPDANADLKSFLTWAATFFFNTQQYEDALAIAQLLIENHVESRTVYDTAARSAFACQEFTLAERYLKTLTKGQGDIEPFGSRLRSIPYYLKEWERECQLRQSEALADDLPRVLLRTNRGEVELELFENEAPNTVSNFVSLVEAGFYDGLTFHIVEPSVGAQSGCPAGTGEGGPGYAIHCECYAPQRRIHFRGSLSMVHHGRNTGGSQFSLLSQPMRGRDGTHTVFGRVVRGLEVLAKLQPRGRDPFSQNIKPDRIIEAKVLRKRDHPYRPQMIPDRWGQQRRREQAKLDLYMTE